MSPRRVTSSGRAQTRLLCGPHRSDREDRINDVVRDHWGQAVLIVPTQHCASARTEGLLREGDLPGVWGEPVTTFARFVQRLLEEEGTDTQPIRDLERFLIVRRALTRPASTGGIPDVADTPGFHNHLLRVLEGLKQAAIEPEAFAERIALRRHGSPLDKLVAEAYAAYQQVLHEEGVYDRIGLFWQAALACRNGPPRLLAEVRVLALDGFDDFTPSEFRLLEALAVRLDLLVFGMNYDPDPERSDLFSIQNRTVERIVRQFHVAPEHFEPRPPATFSQFGSQHLLWRGRPPSAGSCRNNLTLAPCLGLAHEVETIARRVKRLLLDGNASVGDIVVVFRDLGGVTGTVRTVFGEFGIPVCVSCDPTLEESAACGFVLSLLEATEDWRREEIAELLASPWLGPPADATQCSAAPTLARLAGIVGGYADWEQGLETLRRHLELWRKPPDCNLDGCATTAHYEEGRVLSRLARVPGTFDAVETALARLRRLRALAELVPPQATVPAFARAVDELITQCGIEEAIDRHPLESLRIMERHALWEFRSLLGALHDWGQDALSRAAFVALLRQALHTVSFPVQEPDEGVLCLDAEHVRGLRYRYVFFGGVNEGEFPKPWPLNAIYSDQDLDDLQAAGISLETRRQRSDRELVLFHHVLDVAEEELCITWRTISREGREARRSPFLAELLRLFGEDASAVPKLDTDAFVPRLDAIASLSDLRNVAMLRDPPLADSFPEELRPILEGVAIERARNDFTPFGPYDGMVQARPLVEALNDRFGAEHLFSVDQIETYLDCPFQFFVLRVLGIEPIEEPPETFDYSERGQIVHAALHEFHERHRGAPVAELNPEQAVASMKIALEEVMQRFLQRASPGKRPLLEAEKQALEKLLNRYLYWERERGDLQWKPSHFEISFGRVRERSHDPLNRPEPFALGTSIGSLRFSGKIDRIDRSTAGDNLRIIDYKTGEPPSVASIQRGESIQLPVYALACERHLDPGRPCAEARFVHVGYKPKQKVMQRDNGDVWERCVEAAIATVTTAVTAIRSGRFPPTPSSNACGSCPVRNVCRYEEARIARKQGATP